VPGNITSWSWEFSNGATSSLPDPVLVFNQNQIVVATLTIEFETNCTASVTDTVQVRIFDPDFLKDTVIACLPNPMASLNPDGDSTLSYQWAPPAGLSNANDWNPTATVSQTTIYTVTITDASGAEVCTVEKQVTVFVPPAIGLATPPNVEACVATPDTLTATVSGQASLHWSSQADFSDTLSMDASVIVQVGTPPSTYYVMATDAFGCQEMGEVTVGVYPIQAQPPVFPDVCIGETPEVTISGIAPDETLSWQPFDPNTQPLNDTASFVLTITNSRGCTLTDTVILNSLDISNLIEVVPAADTILLGESVDLSVVAGFGHSCSWSPGAGLSNTSDCSPLATPQETTTYTVEVEDITTGCRGTGESVICVVSNLCAEPMIFVPNAFTPDGDGLNDVLYVRGYNIERVIIFAIYNRWGEKVFEAHSQSEGWDGTFNGKTAVGDVFAYYLKVECLSGEEFFKKGNVTVLR
jgi:gliding motility-associated-like protein